jgi:hypothetical protein
MTVENRTNFPFVQPDGSFIAIGQLLKLGVASRDDLLEDNRTLLESFGCATPELMEQGLDFLISVNLDATFSAWQNEDEGTSGVSSRALTASSPGAILALHGLLPLHPAAQSSGEVRVSLQNPQRGRRR